MTATATATAASPHASQAIADREDQLLTAAQRVLDEIDQHEAAADPNANDQPEGFHDELLVAVDDLILLFSTGDLPHNCRGLAAIVAQLAEAWREYAQTASSRAPLPGPKFWQAVGSLRNEFTFSPPTVSEFSVETVAELVGQKVSYNQIALIYSHNGQGPFMRNGQPAVELVKREVASPGAIIGPDWVHPRTAHERQQAERYSNWTAQRAAALRERAAADPYRGAVEGRETIADLINQGVSDAQIAKIKLVTLEAVAAERARIASNRQALDAGQLGRVTEAGAAAGGAEEAPQAKQTGAESPARGKPGRPPKASPADATGPATTDEDIAQWLANNADATTAEAVQALRVDARRVAAVRASLTGS